MPSGFGKPRLPKKNALTEEEKKKRVERRRKQLQSWLIRKGIAEDEATSLSRDASKNLWKTLDYYDPKRHDLSTFVLTRSSSHLSSLLIKRDLKRKEPHNKLTEAEKNGLLKRLDPKVRNDLTELGVGPDSLGDAVDKVLMKMYNELAYCDTNLYSANRFVNARKGIHVMNMADKFQRVEKRQKKASKKRRLIHDTPLLEAMPEPVAKTPERSRHIGAIVEGHIESLSERRRDAVLSRLYGQEPELEWTNERARNQSYYEAMAQLRKLASFVDEHLDELDRLEKRERSVLLAREMGRKFRDIGGMHGMTIGTTKKTYAEAKKKLEVSRRPVRKTI